MHHLALPLALMLSLLTPSAGCWEKDPPPDNSPSDDPADWEVDTAVGYDIEVSELRWVVPDEGLPPEVEPMQSNNNVDILYFRDRLFMAWRTGPTHFASEEVLMYIVSSTDDGHTWDYEGTVDLDADVREPRFLSFGNKLQLLFFEAGTDLVAFEPIRMYRMHRRGLGDWTAPEVLVDGPEVPWRVKVRNGVAWMTSYAGEHYGGADARVEVYFKQSTDGLSWELVDGRPFVYEGGVSEAAFEFDSDGSLWTVTRNEDCDSTGCGSHVCWAPATALADWECPAEADWERYDSPDLFRHGDDIFLVARRDIGGPFGPDGSLIDYSLRPKTTALYQIDKTQRAVVHLQDLPGAGDTAFPSVRRVDAHTFLVANYTSPLDDPDLGWLAGQAGPTMIYFLTIRFSPQS